MNKKMIKVAKDNVIKEIEARLEMDYVKNGWRVIENYNNQPTNPFLNPYNNNYKK